jgi:tetratricopeptide (TPR) repeat protein
VQRWITEIAEAVVAALELRLAAQPSLEGSRGTSSMAAYNEFLLGRQFMARRRLDDLRRAVGAYTQATKLDPTYAAAYAELVIAQVYLSDVTADERGRDQAEATAARAVQLAPGRAEGYSARGWLRTVLKWDWAGAEADLRKAVQLDPTDSVARGRLANLLLDVGRLPEATACARQALDLDPLHATVWGYLASIYTAAGEYPAARTAVNRGLEIQPEDPFLLWQLGEIELVEGHAAAALETYRKVDLEFLRLTGSAMAEHAFG